MLFLTPGYDFDSQAPAVVCGRRHDLTPSYDPDGELRPHTLVSFFLSVALTRALILTCVLFLTPGYDFDSPAPAVDCGRRYDLTPSYDPESEL